jgi:hypothetical protein
MGPSPFFSLVVPTRKRIESLRRFLASIAETTKRPQDLEIILVVDADDPASLVVGQDALTLRHVIVPPGSCMGALNRAGCAAALGRHMMLLNDDVIARTPGWDVRIRDCLRRFPDDIVLVHVNDTLFGQRLCTFPMVSRTFCQIAGGICPESYSRYRIDDHIEDVFNLLGALGKRRTIYFPDLVFEHLNTVVRAEGDYVYASDPRVLATDNTRFEELAPVRKALVLRLLEHIEESVLPCVRDARRERLARLNDPFLLRLPGRQRVDRSGWLRHAVYQLCRGPWLDLVIGRVRRLVGRRGYSGLLAALMHRLAGLVAGGLNATELRLAAQRARYPAVG